MSIRYANASLLKDRSQVMEYLKSYSGLYSLLIDEFKNDPEIYMTALNQDGSVFKDLPKDVRNDSSIFMLALETAKSRQDLLAYAGPRIKSDYESVKASVKFFEPSLQSASTELRNDPELVYQSLGVKFINDKPIFKSRDHFEQDLDFRYNSYFYTSKKDEKEKEKELRDYMQMNEGLNLEFAGEEFRSNVELMEPLIMENPFLYRFALGAAKADESLIKKVLEEEPFCARYVPNDYFSNMDSQVRSYYKKFQDKTISRASDVEDTESLESFLASTTEQRTKLIDRIAFNPYEFKNLSDQQKKDIDLLKAIIDKNPDAINSMYRVPDSIVLYAIEKDASVVENLYKSYKQNKDFMLKAIKVNSEAYDYALKSMTSLKSFTLDAVEKNGLVLEYVDEKFKSNREIILAAVRQEPSALEFIKPELLEDKDLCQVVYDIAIRSGLYQDKDYKKLKSPFVYNRATSKNMPRNFGKAWKKEDLSKLVDQFKAGIALDETAFELGRDIYGCLIKLQTLVNLSDKEFDSLIERYNVGENWRLILLKVGKTEIESD